MAKEGKSEKKSKVKVDPWKNFMEKFTHLSFSIFGKYFRDPPDYEHAVIRLKQANIHETPGMFNSVMAMTVVITTVVSLFVNLVIFLGVLRLEFWYLFVLGITGGTSAVTAVMFPYTISARINNRKDAIDKELPFTLSELAILSSTGLSPIQVLRKMAQRDESAEMSGEFKQIVYKIDIEGRDIISALSETARETPSPKLREILWDLSNMVHEGGDLDVYLRNKADEGLNLRRTLQKELVEKILGYSEMYISSVLMMVLMIGVIAFLLDAMGSTIGGIDAETLLILLSYVIIPVAVIVITIMVTITVSKTE